MQKSEGIVLKSQDFRDQQKIIQVFTQDFGLLSLIVKRITKKAYPLLALTNPFVKAEFVFTESKSDLYRFSEASILNTHLELRADFTLLETAFQMCQSLLSSQLPLKPAPLLYKLFSSYLRAMSEALYGENFLYSFYLKILRHEGLFSSDLFSKGKEIDILSFSRSPEEVGNLSLSPQLKQEIKTTFNSLIKEL